MRDVNKAILIGRLGKDPEIVNFESGTKKASFPLATGESYTNRNNERVESTEWHNIVMWRRLAEIAEQYLRKGDPVYLEGRIRTRSYDDKDGNKRYITEIEALNFSMLGGKNDNSNSSESQSSSSAPKQQNQTSTQNSENSPPDNIDFEDDLPF